MTPDALAFLGLTAIVGSLVAVLILETIGTQEWPFDRLPALARVRDAYGPDAADEIESILPAQA